jgi:hypothetical protein
MVVDGRILSKRETVVVDGPPRWFWMVLDDPRNTPKFKTINDFEMINNNPPFFGLEESWKGVWGYM